ASALSDYGAAGGFVLHGLADRWHGGAHGGLVGDRSHSNPGYFAVAYSADPAFGYRHTGQGHRALCQPYDLSILRRLHSRPGHAALESAQAYRPGDAAGGR